MNNLKRLRSFTISELLVVLVITGIVISMAVLVLTIVQKQFLYIQKHQERSTEWQLLERSLWLDFNRFTMYYDKKEACLWASSPIDTVCYQFIESGLIRNKDTILVQIAAKTFLLNGKTVQNGPLDAIQLKAPATFNSLELFVSKSKAADFYVNNSNLWLLK